MYTHMEAWRGKEGRNENRYVGAETYPDILPPHPPKQKKKNIGGKGITF